MSSAAGELIAERLGASRWRIPVQLAAGSLRGLPTAPGALQVRALTGGKVLDAAVELVLPPRATSRDEWTVLVSVPDATVVGGELVFEVEASGHPPRRVNGALSPTAGVEPRPAAAAARFQSVDPSIDYEARDWDALRTMMGQYVSDRVGPTFDTDVVAQTVAVIEEMAYLGDALSYWQDGVATEAYLVTARRRVSVTRHAATLDYQVDQGANARTWVRVTLAGTRPIVLPAGTQLATGRTDELPSTDVTMSLEGETIFETVSELTVLPDPPPLRLARSPYGSARLPAGATSAIVTGRVTGLVGSLVLFEAVLAATELSGGQVVRVTDAEEIPDAPGGPVTVLSWAQADALPSPALPWMADCQLRVGNLVLADHGRTLPAAPLEPVQAPGPYRPRLPFPGVTFAAPVVGADRSGPAARALQPRGPTLPVVDVVDMSGPVPQRWEVRSTLLDSGPYETDVVVEVENDGWATLRFGDDVNGMRPAERTRFAASERIGGGTAGNLSPYSLVQLVVPDARVAKVEQPVAAVGGSDAERLTAVRLAAPRASRENERAVTAADYDQMARAVEGVEDVQVEMSWSGSWPVVVVYVLTGASWQQDPSTVATVQAVLDERRVAGVEVAVRPASFLPVEVAAVVTAAPSFDVAEVAAGVADVIDRELLAPAAFRFGTVLYRSSVIASLVTVPGVLDVVVPVFRRMARGRQLDTGDRVEPAVGEILRIANDPAAPELGRVTFRIVREER